MSGVGITYLWPNKKFPPFIRLEGKRGDYEVYTPERTCELIDNGTWGYPYGCSECGASFDADVNNGDFNYCPNCGAKVVDEC